MELQIGPRHVDLTHRAVVLVALDGWPEADVSKAVAAGADGVLGATPTRSDDGPGAVATVARDAVVVVDLVRADVQRVASAGAVAAVANGDIGMWAVALAWGARALIVPPVPALVQSARRVVDLLAEISAARDERVSL